MSISIKNSEDIKKMRVAGKLASEVLDFITPFITPNITTEEIDKICHDYMVNEQKTIPAPLNYAPPGHSPYPKSVCTSVNHQICHGIPGPKTLKKGDILFTGTPEGVGPIKIGDQLEGFIESQNMFHFEIR